VQGGQAGATAGQYTFGYDPTGRLTRTTYPTANHLITDRGYDRSGRLADLNSHNDGGTLVRYQMTRDPVGNPAGITTTRGTASQHVAYTYDAFDRITAACVGADCASATGKIAYTYDEVGNRLSQTLSGSAGNSQTTYQYDSGSQLTQSTVTDAAGAQSTAYAYDRSGNLVQAGDNTFTYNLDNTMASATVAGNTTAFAYDALGIQLSATTNASGGASRTRTWQTDVNNSMPQLVAQATTTDGATTNQGFLTNPADGTPLGLLTGGQTDSFAQDPVHGVGEVVDPAGTPVAAYDYDPFGVLRTDGTAASVASSVDNPIQFAGAYQDTTLGDQYSMLARAYDPDTGRFDGVDPISPSIGQPGVSPYAYVADRPTYLRDPSGARPCSSDDNHDKAQLFALSIFAVQYGKFDVYGDCPGWRDYQGRPGRISLTTTAPVSNPDILVGRPGMTWLYEIKPAANQLGEIVWGVTGKRGDNNAAQVQRYLWALSYAGYPNPQPGPNIVPASRSNPDGTITTIFSGVDWNKFAPKSARPDIRNAGIIYYVTTRRPKIPSPKPVPKPVPVPVPVPQATPQRAPQPTAVPTTEPTDSMPGWVKPVAIGGLCVVGGLIIVGTIAEDFFTGGAGILDDAPSFAGAGALFKLAFSL
jgi:RHS repeat-associated protein